MINPPINARTQEALKAYRNKPGQGVGLIGQKWLNKHLIAGQLAKEILNIGKGSLENYPYFLSVGEPTASIGIEEVRALNNFLVLRVPINKPVNRVLLINYAENMTLEAQNALLKNLEEPPKSTVFILTAGSTRDLLPTIVSRLHLIPIHKPAAQELKTYYEVKGFPKDAIDQALLMSEGLPGLMDELLSNSDSPINQAAKQARHLLGLTTFERLSSINQLTKDKDGIKNLLFVIKQMSKVGINSTDPKNAARWQKILSATLDSEKQLSANVQVKLVLTSYMLAIS